MFKEKNYVMKSTRVTEVYVSEIKLEMIRKYLDGYTGKFRLLDIYGRYVDYVDSISFAVSGLSWCERLKIEIINEPIIDEDVITIIYQWAEDFDTKFIV